MEISILVAMTHSGVIGKEGKLPWHISEDLKLFKKRTINNTVIMGRKTFDAILQQLGKPLPERNNIVLSKTLEQRPGIYVANSLEEAIARSKELGKETYVIGGSLIYKEFLDKVNNMYLSLIKKPHEGDTYFPLCNEKEWFIKEFTRYGEFDLIHYKRKKLI